MLKYTYKEKIFYKSTFKKLIILMVLSLSMSLTTISLNGSTMSVKEDAKKAVSNSEAMLMQIKLSLLLQDKILGLL